MSVNRQDAMRRLYGSPDSSPTNYSHARASVYQGRQAAARARRDFIELKRLEAEEKEVTKLCNELGLDDERALRLMVAVRDRTDRPISRTELLENDMNRLKEKYGEQIVDVTGTTATHVQKLLADKPTLAATLQATGAIYDGDLVELACDAVQALGLVKPAVATTLAPGAKPAERTAPDSTPPASAEAA